MQHTKFLRRQPTNKGTGANASSRSSGEGGFDMVAVDFVVNDALAVLEGLDDDRRNKQVGRYTTKPKPSTSYQGGERIELLETGAGGIGCDDGGLLGEDTPHDDGHQDYLSSPKTPPGTCTPKNKMSTPRRESHQVIGSTTATPNQIGGNFVDPNGGHMFHNESLHSTPTHQISSINSHHSQYSRSPLKSPARDLSTTLRQSNYTNDAFLSMDNAKGNVAGVVVGGASEGTEIHIKSKVGCSRPSNSAKSKCLFAMQYNSHREVDTIVSSFLDLKFKNDPYSIRNQRLQIGLNGINQDPEEIDPLGDYYCDAILSQAWALDVHQNNKIQETRAYRAKLASLVRELDNA